MLKKSFIHNEDSIIIGIQEVDLKKPRGESRRASGANHHFSTTLFHLLRRSKAGPIGLLLVLIGATTNFTLVYMNQLPPAWFHTFPDAEQKSLYFGKYMTKAWTHLSTFMVGLYAGYLCRATIQLSKCNGRDPAPANGSGAKHNSQLARQAGPRRRWCCMEGVAKVAAFGCLLAIIFSTFAWSTAELPTPLVSALYDCTSRLVWSVALSGLMIKLCLPGGERYDYLALSRLFSQPACLVLGRLSFLAYLIAPYVHTLVLALQEQSLFPSLYLIFHVILGNIVITYLLALLLSALLEQPVRLALGGLFWRRPSGRTGGTGGLGRRHSAGSSPNGTTSTSAASLAG